MISFEYTIKDSLGIHARPAGLLSKTVKSLDSVITLKKDGKEVNASKLIAVMGMGIKCGDTVTVTADGGDEEGAVKKLKDFFEANL